MESIILNFERPVERPTYYLLLEWPQVDVLEDPAQAPISQPMGLLYQPKQAHR